MPTALWLQWPDTQNWKLALSLPIVASIGPKKAYRLVQKALSGIAADAKNLRLDDVSVLRADAPLLDLLRIALNTGTGTSPIWFKGNVINGQLFPNSLIYRVT